MSGQLIAAGSVGI